MTHVAAGTAMMAHDFAQTVLKLVGLHTIEVTLCPTQLLAASFQSNTRRDKVTLSC
jgi:hypothetical protein